MDENSVPGVGWWVVSSPLRFALETLLHISAVPEAPPSSECEADLGGP